MLATAGVLLWGRGPDKPGSPANATGRSTPTARSTDQTGTASSSTASSAKRQNGGVDWPHFLGPTFDGKSPETGIATDWSAGRLATLWHAPLGTSYGIGSVADGRYFQFCRYDDAERLTCRTADTGELLWQSEQPVEYEDLYGYNNGPRSSPAIAGQRVYTYGVAGRLTCRDCASGQILWTVDCHRRYGVVQNFFGVGCSPVVIGDTVIVMVGGSPPEDQNAPPGALDRLRPNGSAVVAFDAADGHERWRVGDELASYSTPRPLQIDGQPALLTFTRGGLLAVDPVDGQQLWFYPWRADRLESVNAAVPVVSDSLVLISECYDIGSSLLRVRRDGYDVLRTDSPNPRQQSFRAHWATPIEHEGAVYGCSGRNAPDSDLRCVDLLTGAPRWIDARRRRSSLLYVDNHFVVLEEYGLMQLIRATPEQLEVVTEIDMAVAGDGRPALTGPCWAAPILAQGRLYVRGDNHVVCLQLIRHPPHAKGAG